MNEGQIRVRRLSRWTWEAHAVDVEGYDITIRACTERAVVREAQRWLNYRRAGWTQVQ